MWVRDSKDKDVRGEAGAFKDASEKHASARKLPPPAIQNI